MDQITTEYAVRALKARIKKLEEFLEWQRNIQSSARQNLARLEQGITSAQLDQWASITISESSERKLLDESTEKIEKNEPHLANYKQALANIERIHVRKMIRKETATAKEIGPKTIELDGLRVWKGTASTIYIRIDDKPISISKTKHAKLHEQLQTIMDEMNGGE